MISYQIYFITVIIIMALIAYNLFRALYFLVTRKEGGHGTARYLGRRIGLSMLFFLLLIILKLSGIVEQRDLDDIAKEITIDKELHEEKESEGRTLEEIQNEANPDGGRIRLKQ